MRVSWRLVHIDATCWFFIWDACQSFLAFFEKIWFGQFWLSRITLGLDTCHYDLAACRSLLKRKEAKGSRNTIWVEGLDLTIKRSRETLQFFLEVSQTPFVALPIFSSFRLHLIWSFERRFFTCSFMILSEHLGFGLLNHHKMGPTKCLILAWFWPHMVLDSLDFCSLSLEIS